jgi:hypothetical protein
MNFRISPGSHATGKTTDVNQCRSLREKNSATTLRQPYALYQNRTEE